MDEITIVAFNYGNAGSHVNGPGMCLVNFVKKLRALEIKVNVFSKLRSNLKDAHPISDRVKLKSAISRSGIVHHWSGMDSEFVRAISLANDHKATVLIGPNVLDTVKFGHEKIFLSRVKYDKVLTVNERLKFRLSKMHSINIDKIDLLMVGPDAELWAPIDKDNGKILWKGNSTQRVKDVHFGLEVKRALPEYDFEFIGHPNPYDYKEHITSAKSCHLYISTSLSETMGLALTEQWCAGIPSVTHPKIYLHGENYKTGIITNRTVSDYCDTIREIMEDDTLYRSLSTGAIDYVRYNMTYGLGIDYLDKYYWTKK
jgi:glycosyltransferase involved in cell wall biosynthesis